MDDDLPFDSIYDALINRIPPPPNQATQAVRNIDIKINHYLSLYVNVFSWLTINVSTTVYKIFSMKHKLLVVGDVIENFENKKLILFRFFA